MSVAIDSLLEKTIARTPARHVIAPRRGARFLQFCGVGASGMVVDLSITFALLGEANYLLANVAGFIAAVTWNFAGNWLLTYNRPAGRLSWQYVSYVILHSATFGLRAVALTVLIESTGTSASVATLVGIGIAAIANFTGTEGIFGGVGETWFDIVEAGNHLAHVVYSSRIRTVLVATGLYNTVFRAYTVGLALVYRARERTIHVNGASATLATEEPTEIVSVLHTLEKERPVLARFVDDVQPGDRVLDAGANVGVFASLAEDIGADVTAVEPHRETADRLRQNIDGNVIEAALGTSIDTVQLSVTNDAAGTQRPEVNSEGERTVPQIPGDRLGKFDVVKIDVEGAEQDVLNGLSWGLPFTRVVFVEAHSPEDTRMLRRKLTESGYTVRRIAENEQIYLRGER